MDPALRATKFCFGFLARFHFESSMKIASRFIACRLRWVENPIDAVEQVIRKSLIGTVEVVV